MNGFELVEEIVNIGKSDWPTLVLINETKIDLLRDVYPFQLQISTGLTDKVLIIKRMDSSKVEKVIIASNVVYIEADSPPICFKCDKPVLMFESVGKSYTSNRFRKIIDCNKNEEHFIHDSCLDKLVDNEKTNPIITCRDCYQKMNLFYFSKISHLSCAFCGSNSLSFRFKNEED